MSSHVMSECSVQLPDLLEVDAFSCHATLAVCLFCFPRVLEVSPLMAANVSMNLLTCEERLSSVRFTFYTADVIGKIIS